MTKSKWSPNSKISRLRSLIGKHVFVDEEDNIPASFILKGILRYGVNTPEGFIDKYVGCESCQGDRRVGYYLDEGDKRLRFFVNDIREVDTTLKIIETKVINVSPSKIRFPDSRDLSAYGIMQEDA